MKNKGEDFVNKISGLLKLNHYTVKTHFHIAGAEIDLKAESLRDPLAPPIFMEITTQYVDNTKYGKDLTKLAMVREKFPESQIMIISEKGFTAPVRERAKETNIITYTFDELRKRFEHFEFYIEKVLTDKQLQVLEKTYEEPFFQEKQKIHATGYLNNWKLSSRPEERWLIVVGEYGTGKTALTRILQRRWVQDYHKDPRQAIPFRIELNNFTKQFEADGLLHHFLDHNSLGHLSLDFVYSLIREERIILLLDGYDEMAQYLLPQERRTCLEALARLSAMGAKGILTSRPNYFTQNEELRVAELLLKRLQFHESLDSTRYSKIIQEEEAAIIRREKEIDTLLQEHILNRFELRLKDLTEPQTKRLVHRILADKPKQEKTVLNLLEKIRSSEGITNRADLSGKPVIISMLLQVAEGNVPDLPPESNLDNEWDLFDYIIKGLLIRDFKKVGIIPHTDRRRFLKRLALYLSRKGNQKIGEEDFRDLIRKEFSDRLQFMTGQEKREEISRLFSDLRRSSTLTRSHDTEGGWKFSHNSLREFLLAELLLEKLKAGQYIDETLEENVPITDVMRKFVASIPAEKAQDYLAQLARTWPSRTSQAGAGLILSLLWDMGKHLFADTPNPERSFLKKIDPGLDISRIRLKRIVFQKDKGDTDLDLNGINFSYSELTDLSFCSCDLKGANFKYSYLINVLFKDCSLAGANFRDCPMLEIHFTGSELTNADFRGVDTEYLVVEGEGPNGEIQYMESMEALGFLKFHGAITDKVAPYFIYCHHSRFYIVEKICRKLTEGKKRQRRGLVQRGAAQRDPKFAERFLDHLQSSGLVEEDSRGLVYATTRGRNFFTRFCNKKDMCEIIADFFYKER